MGPRNRGTTHIKTILVNLLREKQPMTARQLCERAGRTDKYGASSVQQVAMVLRGYSEFVRVGQTSKNVALWGLLQYFDQTLMTANDCVDFLRMVKSTMPDEVWEEWFARIKEGAEGKDDW